ncbi:hypothetical protein [Longitalea luteola]|uniref:hypothetical protein n=1 Tax=Longitalea luteola TaxID=2812563 RepID=UPI001A96CE2D|nr:hypothetical protein [Longitalea luteola]
MIDLTHAELFQDLTTIDYENSFFDLHNDYACTGIDYQSANKTVGFLFQPITKDSGKKVLLLQFEDALIASFSVNLRRTADSNTLDLFYRGRFEISGKLFDFHPDGGGVFYIDFWEGDSFTISSKKVTLMF